MNEENLNWVKRITQARLTDEPYPTATYTCTDCDMTWDDTDDPTCFCEEDGG